MNIWPSIIKIGVVMAGGWLLAACESVALNTSTEPLSASDVGQLSSQVSSKEDPLVGARKLRRMLAGNTLVTRSFSNPGTVQYGYFNANGDLLINPRTGVVARGNWELSDDGICYRLDPSEFCSRAHVAKIDKDGTTSLVYYFAREATGEETVAFSTIIPGNAIPAERLN